MFIGASATYDNSTTQTNITVTIKDTGSIFLKPNQMFIQTVPSGTNLVSGSWLGKFYAADGTLLCVLTSIPPGCSGHPPDTSNGGTIWVTFLVTGATEGENLTLTYTFNQNGLIATNSTTFRVS